MTTNQKLTLLHETRMTVTGIIIPLVILAIICEKEFHISQKIKNKWNERKQKKLIKNGGIK